MVRDRACTKADLNDSNTLTAYACMHNQYIELPQLISYHFRILGCKQIAVILLVFFVSASEGHKLVLFLALHIMLTSATSGCG